MRSAPRGRRSGGSARAAGTAALLWIANCGCLTFEGHRGIVPFFEIYEGPVASSGAGKVADSDPEGLAASSREYVFRPLGSLESIGSRRRRVKLLWPFIDASWGGGEARAWALPLLFYRQRPVPQLNDSDIDFMLFPFVYAGYEPGAGGYFGILPLGGKLRGLLAKDEIDFFLFPLYWRALDEGQDSLHLVWPFFNRVHGGGRSGWRLWPFYGHYEAEDRDGEARYRRSFVLWPFFISQENKLNSSNPSELFFSFPFYGQDISDRYETRTYFWPFWTTFHNKENEDREYGGNLLPYRFARGQYDFWPLFGWKTQKRSALVSVLKHSDPLGGLLFPPEVELPDTERDYVRDRFRQFALWPIQRYQVTETRTSRERRFWFLPLFWHFHYEKEGLPEPTSEWKVWPLFRYRSEMLDHTFYFPSPLFFRQENPFERQWARLWRLFLYHDSPERSGWELGWGILSHRYEKEEKSRTFSVLYGLLEWEQRPQGPRFRFLYLPWR